MKQIVLQKNGTIRETRNIYSLASFVELYYDPMIDNDWQQVRIKDELISLNELFVPPQKQVWEIELEFTWV